MYNKSVTPFTIKMLTPKENNWWSFFFFKNGCMVEGQEQVGCEVFLGRLSTLVSQGLTSKVPLKTGVCKRQRTRLSSFLGSSQTRLDEWRAQQVYNKGLYFCHQAPNLCICFTFSTWTQVVPSHHGRKCFQRGGRHQRERVNTPSSWSKCRQCKLIGPDLCLEGRRRWAVWAILSANWGEQVYRLAVGKRPVATFNR